MSYIRYILISFVCLLVLLSANGVVSQRVDAAPASLFTRNLSVDSEGVDVQMLQQYLNSRGFIVAEAGPGSVGNETTRYGALTRLAVVRFQEAHAADILKPAGLHRGTGNFFGRTRAYVNEHAEGFASSTNTRAGGKTSDAMYAVGGSITGITGPVVLTNQSDRLVIQPGEGSEFVFPTTFSNDAAYAIRVAEAPGGQQCYFPPGQTGEGVISGGNATSIRIQCTSTPGWNPFIPRVSAMPYFSVGGSVSGLTGAIVLQNNGGDALTLSANGAFTFSRSIATATVYAVTVLTQPSQQTCTVTNGAGTVAVTAVTDVSVVCVTNVPTVTSIAPGNGPTEGGTAVLITGTGFTGATAVRFGATMGTPFFIINDTTLSATAPAGSVGQVHITVTTPAGTSVATNADLFTYFTLFEAWARPAPYRMHARFAWGAPVLRWRELEVFV
ncbi:MAG: IPT/TIG domain-containing protein [Candidatus Doudnabacteria bacterium]|nr:IPT/TIG domain-containing protein [Candidatus Doudnabacteria bacterium]